MAAGAVRRRGLALVLAASVLGVLAVLGTAFVALASLERRASQQRLWSARALLAARSGLEDALARLSGGQAADYGGENWDGLPGLSPLEAQHEVFHPGVLDVESCPVRHALRPSFFVRPAPGNPDPALVDVDGRKRGYSGLLGQASYAIRVEDESAKIHVNGGFLDTQDRDADGILDHQDLDVRTSPADPKDTGLGWNAQLVKALNTLGAQPEVMVPNLGTLIMRGRPPGGYRTIQQIQKVRPDVLTGKDLSPYLAVSVWSDPGVVHPNGYAAQVGQISLSDVKRARLPLRLEERGRAPVNLNAATRPVLIALLQGLAAKSWASPAFPEAYTISPPLAAAIADRMIAMRPFADWEAFGAFCDGLVPGTITGMHAASVGGGNLCAVDLLKANFDPNTGLNKQLPDQILWRWIDKSDLTHWSTEGSLGPTGAFRLSVVGRVAGLNGALAAQAFVSGGFDVFSLTRQTSQADFVGGRPYLPGYLSLATDPLLPTTGTSAGAAWWGGPPPGTGLGAITYPCGPCALPGGAADFDGAVGLATTELPKTDPLNGTLRFLHHLDQGWDAQVGTPGSRLPGPGVPPSDLHLQSDPAMGVWPAASGEPGAFLPDGVHIQTLRCPAFDAPGNLPRDILDASRYGAISYWVKPSPIFYQPPQGYEPIFPGRVEFSCVKDTVTNGTQVVMIGAGDMSGDRWTIVGENSADIVDDGDILHARENWACFQRQMANKTLQPGMRWLLVSAHVDLNEASPEDMEVAVRGVGPGALVPDDYLGSMDPTLLQDLAVAGVRFVLGNVNQGAITDGNASNQVMDEFALCDFGSVAAFALPHAQVWASLRYAAGRYYKSNDAEFRSTVIQPADGAPVRLKHVRWTARLPRESRQEIFTDFTPSTSPAGQPRLLDATLLDARLEVGLDDVAHAPLIPKIGQGQALDRVLPAFSYRVRFLPTPGWTPVERDNQPVLETPFLDDITFAWQAFSGPIPWAWDAS